MIKVMRTHAKYFYFLFFIVIISFVFWGIGPVDETGEGSIVAKVGKHKITTENYWRTYDNVSRLYRQIYKDKFDEEMEKRLKEEVLNSMIDEKVLLIAAEDVGITVSDEELYESITREPAFMKNGIFNKEVYLNRLRLNRITPAAYEDLKRQELKLNKMRRLIELSVDIADVTLKQASADKQLAEIFKEVMLRERKDKAVKSYIEGLKRQIRIKINTNLIY